MVSLRLACSLGALWAVVPFLANAQDCNGTVSHSRHTRTVMVPPPRIASKATPNSFSTAATSRASVPSAGMSGKLGSTLRAPTTLSTVIASASTINNEASPTTAEELIVEETATAAAASKPSNLAPSVVSSVLAKVQPTSQCGVNNVLALPGTGMTVANSMYGADLMTGTQCTNYDTINQAGIVWTSVSNVEKTNPNDAKGYSNIGLGKNVKNRLSSISSIPVYYKWERTNTTEFRGNNCFDFITAPTVGLAGDNPASSEFMLWLAIWGNQVPIGYAQGPVETFDLFGVSWNLYSGKNPLSGVTVRSMLPNSPINGEFSGDLKDWLEHMVTKGYIAATDYVNIGNAGSEIFYGHAVMNATVFLTINL